jgi:hypothetical protein
METDESAFCFLDIYLQTFSTFLSAVFRLERVVLYPASCLSNEAGVL